MFVHAFLVVASGTSLVRITRKASRVRRLRVVCARRIQARGAESTAITRSHGARVRACVCARFLPRSLGTTVVRVTRKALCVSRLLVRRIRDAEPAGHRVQLSRGRSHGACTCACSASAWHKYLIPCRVGIYGNA